ncbi:MAG: hypothetical protein OER22_04000, partial [Gammaproteobacteria bacterium]|nr:hypothetical protein [Gammaproteobacteria bacterium]
MVADPNRVIDALNRQFFIDFPLDAAREIESLNVSAVAAASARQPAKVLAPVWQRLLPDRAASLLQEMPDSLADRLLEELPPPRAVRILGCMSADERSERMARLDPLMREDLEL